MGFFEKNTGFDADVEKATTERNTDENWSSIMDVCDKVSLNPRHAKECLRAIMKRMNHNDPHVVMQAITLLNACVSNCGKPFHLEIASRDFENEFKRLLSKAQPKISLKLRQILKTWAEKDFKQDPELNLIPSLYLKLQQEGYDFSNLNEKPAKSSSSLAAESAAAKDPNVVSSQQEEDDLVRAIELSLQDVKNSPKQMNNTATDGKNWSSSTSNYPSLYPSFGGNSSASCNANNISNGSGSAGNGTAAATSTSQNNVAETRKVRALYDFEAAEDNELTFYAGEIVHVMDDSDPNWWKGCNQRGEGLFPSNFVSADLSIDPDSLEINQQHKNSKSDDALNDNDQQTQQKSEQDSTMLAAKLSTLNITEIDESKIDRLLHLLHEANPEDPSQDTKEMLDLEREVHQMGPLIDNELERVDRKHAQLSQLSSDLVDAINVYHSLMRVERVVRPPINTSISQMASGAAVQGDAGVGTHYLGSYMSSPIAGAGNYTGPSSMPQFGNGPVTGGLQQPTVMGGAMGGVFNPQLHTPFNNNNGNGNIPMQYQNGHLGLQMNPGQLQMAPGQPMSLPPQPQQQHPVMFGGQMPAVAYNRPPTSQVLSANGDSTRMGLVPPQPQDRVSQQQQPPNQYYRVNPGQALQPPSTYMSPQHQVAMAGAEQPPHGSQATQVLPQVNGGGVAQVAVPQTAGAQLPYATMMNTVAAAGPATGPANNSMATYSGAVPLEQYNHTMQQQQQHQQQQMTSVNVGSAIQTQMVSSAGYNGNLVQNIPTYQQAQP